MPQFRYRVVDVFTETKLEGNPLAVFPEASGLADSTMQQIAQELNLAESAFVLPSTRPDCVAQVRIFTPAREMRFAGHPTIGTSWVLLDEGAAPRTGFALDELVGSVPIRVDGNLVWLKTPPITFGQEYGRAELAAALGVAIEELLDVPPQWVSAGNPNVYIALRSREAVDRAVLDPRSLPRLKAGGEPVCVFVFSPEQSGAYSRMFAPEHGVAEDPATGSATGPLAAYMAKYGLCAGTAGTRLVSEQGVKMGRRSLLHILFTAEGVEVGGSVVPIVSAVMDL